MVSDESECYLATNETGDILYKEELGAEFNFLHFLKTGKVDCKIPNWVKRNKGNFEEWENLMCTRTAYGLLTIITIPSQRFLMRTFHNEIGHGDFETSKHSIWTNFSGLVVRKIH